MAVSATEQARVGCSIPLMVRGVDHLVFNTDNMAATIAFYSGVLGMPLVHVARTPNVADKSGAGEPPVPNLRHYFFDMGNDSILAFFEIPKGAEPAHNRNAIGGAQHVALVVTAAQFAKLEDHLKAHNVSYLPAVQQGPGMYGIYFYDPNGIRLEFACQPAQGEHQEIIGHFTQTKAQARAELATLPGATAEWVEKRVAALPD